MCFIPSSTQREAILMKPEELERFQQLLAAYVQAMRLQGLRERTIETYSRSLWQVSKHFQRCPDDLGLPEKHQRAN
jgi:hypothetical protein